MTAATTTPLQSKFGPIIADAAGTITIQEASDVLDCSRFRINELLTANAGRVLVTDVLALKSPVPSSTIEAPPPPSLTSKPIGEPVDPEIGGANATHSRTGFSRGWQSIGALKRARAYSADFASVRSASAQR